MTKVIKVSFEDLIFVDITDFIGTGCDYFDMNRNYNFYEARTEARTEKKVQYSQIIYIYNSGNKKIEIKSHKINLDIDNLKIKIFLQGHINIICNNNLSDCRFDTSFLYL